MLIVFGSVSMDLELGVPRFPDNQETVTTNSFFISPGGKGASQALAATKIGAKTAIVGRIGEDGAGLRISKHLKKNGVLTSGLAIAEEAPTGMTVISRDTSGQTRTTVAAGANAEISASQVPLEILNQRNMLLLQTETPLDQSEIVMKGAKANGATVIMNLAPAMTMPKHMLALIDYLIVNKSEALHLGKKLNIDARKDMHILAAALAKEGDLTCIVTMGDRGSVCIDPKGLGFKVGALKIENVVDPAGAGDCFNGTFAACLHEKMELPRALRHASIAGGLSCMKKGTMESFPYLSEIEEVLKTFSDLKPV